jgi:hypothetical protein
MKHLKSFNESEDLYLRRDMNIKNQILDFISFFSEVTDERISEYLDKGRMDNISARSYFETIKEGLSAKKDNDVYGYLIDDYISIIDQILDKI